MKQPLIPIARRYARSYVSGALGIVVSLVGASTFAAPPLVDARSAAATAISTSFTRPLTDAAGQVTAVQTAIREFEPKSSEDPKIYLVAVTHIGDKAYYEEIQKLLDKQDLVLFEGVRPSKVEDTKTLEQRKVDSEKAHTLQKRLANALGAEFQLDGIQYKRPNFRNSDLSWDDLVTNAKASGAGAAQQLDQLQAMMNGGQGAGFSGAMLDGILKMVETNPTYAVSFRQMLVKMLADPKSLELMQAQLGRPAAGSPANSNGDLSEVIIEERNAAVIKDLKVSEAKLHPGSSVALFYGAGHMPNLEHRLVDEMGYRPGTVQWLTALTTNSPAKPTATPTVPAPATSASAAPSAPAVAGQ